MVYNHAVGYLVIERIREALCTDEERGSRCIRQGMTNLNVQLPASKYFRL